MAGAYWPAPWTCEDGGPRRWGCPTGQAGLGIRPGERLEVAAARDAFATDVLVRRGPGELYALRHDIPLRGPQSTPVEGWVERLDPATLEVLAATPRLPAGAWWPGGIAAHANGDLHMVLGRWAHRLSAGLDVLASHRLPVERPHNSFVVLDGGQLVTKDCDAPAGREPSTVSVLDPETLLAVAPPLRLPEPCIARLASRRRERRRGRGGQRLPVAPGRGRRAAGGRRALAPALRPRARPQLRLGSRADRPSTSSGWTTGATAPTARCAARASSPSPCACGGRAATTTSRARCEISGLPYGTESNPPGWDPDGRIVVAYDAGNAVLRAWRVDGDELEPLWRRDGFAHAGHLILYPDTRELVAQDLQDTQALRRPAVRRALRPLFQAARAVGRRAAGVAAQRPRRARRARPRHGARRRPASRCRRPRRRYLFPAPGFGRDVYYQSLTTIARVAVA